MNEHCRKYWGKFLNETGIASTRFGEAWRLGNSPEMADELGQLVLEGKKTATASVYDPEKQPILAASGDYDILLDGRGNPIAVLKIVKVLVTSFYELDEDHAYKEGEGDGSLPHWRKIHEEFWWTGFEAAEIDLIRTP